MPSKNIKKQVVSFLKENFMMEIATAYKNKPSAAVVVYVIDNDLNFYFVTHTNSRKTNNLIKNPQISMAIWQFDKMLVQIDGKAIVIKDKNKKSWVMDSFADIATNDPKFWAPILKMNNTDYTVFKITPKWMRALDITPSTVSVKASPFVEIKL